MNDLITNGSDIKRRIISEINNATQCIYIAMAWFTDRDIANAVIEAKNRNIAIDIILSSNIQNDTVKLMFKSSGINVHAFETGDTRGIMHHKFCLIDNNISINGSYNYSINAANNNVENVQVSDDKGIYSQFLSEFERLKYNIDHEISVSQVQEQEPITDIMQKNNLVDTFSQQLHNLIYSATQINEDTYKKIGYDISKENKGNIDIFRTEYNNIKEKVNTYATDDGLGNIKNTLLSNISIAYENMKINLENEKIDNLAFEKRNTEIEKQNIKDKISVIKDKKIIIESGNNNTGERGLLQINKDIDKIKIELNSLENSFIVKKFWSVGTILIAGGLLIFSLYLSIFFSSAIYKIFFETDFIRKSLEDGVNPGIPQVVDANAIIKIFREQGILFGLISFFFFLIPILLSNLKIIGSKNKYINKLFFFIGILIFDVIVSFIVAANTFEIKRILTGQNITMELLDVIKQGEFWLIFVFGMFPLIIVHYMIEYLSNAYKNSNRDIIDAEKNKRIKFLNEEILNLNTEKEVISSRINTFDDLLNEYNLNIQNLENILSNRCTQIELKYSENYRQIRLIFEDYSAKIKSGRIFTNVILDYITAAFKSGYIEFLPEYYSSDQIASRVKEIDLISSK